MTSDESPPYLVFRSGEQYIFALDNCATTLPVRLSSAAIGLFKNHGIGADGLARRAARWAMSRGMVSVDLALTSEYFTELYLTVSTYLQETCVTWRSPSTFEQ
jgi:hypothetical protein